MFRFILPTIIGSISLIEIVIIIIICKLYRKTVREKERDIIHHIRIQDQLEKELHLMSIEKNALEKLLQDKFEYIPTANKKDK